MGKKISTKQPITLDWLFRNTSQRYSSIITSSGTFPNTGTGVTIPNWESGVKPTVTANVLNLMANYVGVAPAGRCNYITRITVKTTDALS